MISKLPAAFVLILCIAVSAVVHGGLIVGPVSVSTDMGTAVGAADNMINQSGLNTNYISGVTPSTYTSTHLNSSPNIWLSSSSATGFVTFDLGSTSQLTGLRLWNAQALVGGNSAGLLGFTMLSDSDDDATNGGTTVLGSFNAVEDSFVMQSFAINANTRFVHLNVTSNHGGAIRTGIGEVAFVATPEPTSLLFLTPAVLAIAVRRSRRRNLL